MTNRRRRYCVYFSRRYVDVFNTFYFVFKFFYFLFKIFYFLFKIFYFLSKIIYFVSKIFSCVYFFRRPVDVIRAINFVCKIFNFRLEKAKKTCHLRNCQESQTSIKRLRIWSKFVFCWASRKKEDGRRGSKKVTNNCN